jgi:hypothetical protein
MPPLCADVGSLPIKTSAVQIRALCSLTTAGRAYGHALTAVP